VLWGEGTYGDLKSKGKGAFAQGEKRSLDLHLRENAGQQGSALRAKWGDWGGDMWKKQHRYVKTLYYDGLQTLQVSERCATRGYQKDENESDND